MPEASRPPPARLPPPHGVARLGGSRIRPLWARATSPPGCSFRDAEGGIPANASRWGFAMGTGAARRFLGWRIRGGRLGFGLCIAWLIFDGLDGMVARATGTASALGRFLDGACDHGVFLILYLALGAAIDTPEAWITGSIAGLVHGVQANLYESERARYHRRLRGDPGGDAPAALAHWLFRPIRQVRESRDRLPAPGRRGVGLRPRTHRLRRGYASGGRAPAQADDSAHQHFE